MARWQPDARGRLLHAAIELFGEQGYDATTAAQIAERAGLTKTTLFRHFADKREILFQGQDMLVGLATEGVRDAPRDSAPFALVRAGVLALSTLHPAESRETGRLVDEILAASSELQERATFKRAAITAALYTAVVERTGDPRQAGVLADAGIRAYYDGFAAWVEGSEDGPLAEVVEHELAAYERMLAPVAGS
ncbi:TetR/AcrR family transcriptional regulator [Microbacterium sp. P05]|uniref:TetR/AcrR family transcriptional regulator n=1 Tax=Microbacterium sp. P05 TaxID=3366948 RepID=UPI0037467D07